MPSVTALLVASWSAFGRPAGRHITLPRLGTIRLHEHRPDLVALIEARELRILSATVRLEHERWFVSLKTCSGCGVAKAKLPLSVRVFACDHCGLVLDRDANAALNLAALAARNTGTGVAGDLGSAKAEPKPRGADQKTRTTTRSRKATGGRARGATLPHQRQTETGDRTQAEALTLW